MLPFAPVNQKSDTVKHKCFERPPPGRCTTKMVVAYVWVYLVLVHSGFSDSDQNHAETSWFHIMMAPASMYPVSIPQILAGVVQAGIL